MKNNKEYHMHLPPEMRPYVSKDDIRKLISEFAGDDFGLNHEGAIRKIARWLKSHGIEVEK